jgi:hypothetical protein
MPNLFRRAALITAELLETRLAAGVELAAAVGAELAGETAGIVAPADVTGCEGLRPDSVSRFKRFKSPRKSAADW